MKRKLAFFLIFLCGIVQYNQAGENQNKKDALTKYLIPQFQSKKIIATYNNYAVTILPDNAIQFGFTTVHPKKIQKFNNFYNNLFYLYNIKTISPNLKSSYYSPIALKTAQDGIKILGGLVVANLLGIKTGPKIQIPLFTAALLNNIYKANKDYKGIKKEQLTSKDQVPELIKDYKGIKKEQLTSKDQVPELIKEFKEKLLYKSPLNELGFITQLLQCNDQTILSQLIPQKDQNELLFKNGQKDFNTFKNEYNNFQKTSKLADHLINFINNPFEEKNYINNTKRQFLQPISDYEQEIEQKNKEIEKQNKEIEQKNKEVLYKSMKTVGLFGLSCFAYNYQTPLINLGLTGLKTIKKSITH